MADSPESKMRSPDRILVLTIIDPKQGTGLMDPQSFGGNNPLHARMDTQTSLWYLQYERGVVPEPLKQKFTSFKAVLKHAGEYFKKRNIEIKEVKD